MTSKQSVTIAERRQSVSRLAALALGAAWWMSSLHPSSARGEMNAADLTMTPEGWSETAAQPGPMAVIEIGEPEGGQQMGVVRFWIQSGHGAVGHSVPRFGGPR